jgi:hypothetical protein
MFDLYRMFDPPPSSFAQIFERVMKTVNQRGLTLFLGVAGDGPHPATRSNECLNVPTELFYRQAYGTD